MRRDKQRELFVELINKQLEPFDKKYEDVINDPKWFDFFTLALICDFLFKILITVA